MQSHRPAAGALDSQDAATDDTAAAAFDIAPVAMALIGLDGRYLKVNQALCQLLGYSHEQLLGSDAQLPRSGRFLPANGPPSSIETNRLHAEGHSIPVLLTLRPIRRADGSLSHIFAVVHDLTERKRIEDALAHRALHDDLTGVANRTLFLDRLAHALVSARRRGTATAILFVDLDGFKAVNDTHGHAAGDAVLKSVALRLGTAVRSADSVGRFGGDEFLVLQEDITDISEAMLVADRLQASLAEPFDLSTGQVVLTASVGVVMSESTSTEDAHALVERADAAMYRAKAVPGPRSAL